MERTQASAEGAAVLAALVHRVARERDPVSLVRRTLDHLRGDLGASWSIAVATGDSALGGLRLVHGCDDAEQRVAALELPAEAPHERYVLCRSGDSAGVVLWLPQHTRLVVVLGPCPPEAVPWLEALDGAGRFLLGRLGDLVELSRALLANTALEGRISDLSLLFKGLDITLSSVELKKVLRAFLTCVTSGEAIGFNRAFLLLIDDEQRELRGVVAVGPSSGEEASKIWRSIQTERPTLDQILRRSIEDPETEPEPGSLADRVRKFALPLDPDVSVLARAAMAPAGAYNIHEYRPAQGPEPFADAFGSPEFVVIPIQGRERTLGVIVADNLYTGTPIAKDNSFLLSGLANHVGVVIENALMFEDLSRRYDELSEVQYINRALLSSTDYGQVLHQIAQISAAMLRATGTLLFVTEGQPSELRLEMQYAADGPALPGAAVERCTEVARAALERHAGVLVRDTSRDPAALREVASLLGAPMQIDTEAVGALVVYRASGADPERTVRFDRHSQRFLSIIADLAAIAILSGRALHRIREDQKQIQQLNELLYRNEKLAALGEVSSKIAHEIRNPLTALGGFARRMLKSPHMAASDREAVEIIVRETARLERILNDQLAFVRSARLQLAPTSLNALVREVQSLLRHQFEARRATLRLHLDPGLPSVELDADRIRQVLVNLLMNAIEAMETSGTVQVTTRSAPDAVELEVANTGAPIDPEVAQTLFMPFSTTKQEGTGLGMAVVHQIVVEHSGTIQVRSNPPWGGVFVIRLPHAPPGPDADESDS